MESVEPAGREALTKALNHNNTLLKLDFSHQQSLPSLQSLTRVLMTNNSRLKSLDLSYSNLGFHAEFVHLIEALERSTSLEELDLSSNTFQADQSKALASMLRASISLKTLTIRGYHGADIWFVAAALKTNTSLVSLDLSGWRIDDAVVLDTMSESLSTNTVLQSLDLSRVHLSHHSFLRLLASLRTNSTLRVLKLAATWRELESDELRHEVVQELASILKSNSTLEQLDLTYNNISSDNGKVLADALHSNQKLLHLNLRCNELDGTAIGALSNALKKTNDVLLSLDLSDFDLDSASAAFIAEAIETDKTLGRLALTWDKISEEYVTRLASAFESNFSFVSMVSNDAKDYDLYPIQIETLCLRNKALRAAETLSGNPTEQKLPLRAIPLLLDVFQRKPEAHVARYLNHRFLLEVLRKESLFTTDIWASLRAHLIAAARPNTCGRKRKSCELEC